MANYALEITQPQPSLTTANRYYKAYPGLEYKVPIGVFGGLYPFTYSLTVYPSGMTINSSTGIITWSNPTVSGSPHNVTVSVTDAESTTVTRSWTITVTTAGFIFVDGTNGHSVGDGGTGTFANPFLSMVDFYEGTDYDSRSYSTYQGYFVYWRAGTYALEGFDQDNEGVNGEHGSDTANAYRIQYNNNKPMVWLGYPGETVIIDQNITGRWINTYSSANDLFFGNLTFQDADWFTWRGNGHRHVFYDCIFKNLTPYVPEENSSFLKYDDVSSTPTHQYCLISNCTFDNVDSSTTEGAYLKFYSMLKLVISDCTFTDAIGTGEGGAIKGSCQYVDIRNNRASGILGDVIAGNWNGCLDLEIRYNLILGADTSYGGDGDPGALTINHDGNAGVAYIHHNTLVGNIVERKSGVGDGPFNFYNNVVVNENAGDDPVNSHINAYEVTATQLVLTDNLVGSESGDVGPIVIDVSGNLVGEYRTSYLGLRGYELGEGGSPSQSLSPSISPSVSPSKSPSRSPSISPSISPSRSPSISPSRSPSKSPSTSPSHSPSASPSLGAEYARFIMSVSPQFTDGSPTTAQLIAPTGKASGTHFLAGTIEEDSPVVDSIDLGRGYGSEPVTNGDMELDSDWTTVNTPATNERSNIQKYGGTYSRHIVDSTASWGGARNTSFTSVTGTSYRITGWYYNVEGTSRLVWLRGSDGNGMNIQALAGTGSWMSFDVDYAETGGGTNASVAIINNSNVNPAEFYFDDISAKEIRNKYTEIEWCVQATSLAETGVTYEFRVTKGS